MNKKGILVVSVGSTYAHTRATCIEPLENEIAQVFENYIFCRAYTNPIVRKIIKKRENIHVPSIEEALQSMYEEGITHCVIQPTHLIWGIETAHLHNVVNRFSEKIPHIHVGTPLFHQESDYKAVIDALGEELKLQEFSWKRNDDNLQKALVFVGHGTNHENEIVYHRLEEKFQDRGYENIYIGTIEGDMNVGQVTGKLKEKGIQEVVLHPLLLVAGVHAQKDIVGDEENSFKSLLQREGFHVSYILKGLGEYETIRKIYVEHGLQVKW